MTSHDQVGFHRLWRSRQGNAWVAPAPRVLFCALPGRVLRRAWENGRPLSGSQIPGDRDARDLSEPEQTAADADQTGADLDQTTADSEQSASDSDQRAADRDQQSADRDEAILLEADNSDDGGARYARSRRDRSLSARERDASSITRSVAAELRDTTAVQRDRDAAKRDALAFTRDHLAATIDAEIGLLESEAAKETNGREFSRTGAQLRAARDRKRAAASRDRASAQRHAAALDREQSAADRAQAAADRRAAADELALEGLDHLTGALGRRVGLAAIGRELDRAGRVETPLVLAFVDVDGLKAINDSHGHPAGDQALRDIASCIAADLRSYDLFVRFGGDEFICVLSGQHENGVRQRFDLIAARLAKVSAGQTFSVGLAERQPDEPLHELIARADIAMIGARQLL